MCTLGLAPAGSNQIWRHMAMHIFWPDILFLDAPVSAAVPYFILRNLLWRSECAQYFLIKGTVPAFIITLKIVTVNGELVDSKELERLKCRSSSLCELDEILNGS